MMALAPSLPSSPVLRAVPRTVPGVPRSELAFREPPHRGPAVRRTLTLLPSLSCHAFLTLKTLFCSTEEYHLSISCFSLVLREPPRTSCGACLGILTLLPYPNTRFLNVACDAKASCAWSAGVCAPRHRFRWPMVRGRLLRPCPRASSPRPTGRGIGSTPLPHSSAEGRASWSLSVRRNTPEGGTPCRHGG